MRDALTDKIIEFLDFYLASFRLLLVVIACAHSHTRTGYSPWSRDHSIPDTIAIHFVSIGFASIIATLCSLHIILFGTPLLNTRISSPDFNELPFWLLLLLYCHRIHFNDVSYFHWKFASLFVLLLFSSLLFHAKSLCTPLHFVLFMDDDDYLGWISK